MIYEIKDTAIVKALFQGWDKTIIRSCLQGVMGHVFANDEKTPTAAMAMLGDFCFFAGEPSKELVAYKPDCCRQGFMIMVPQTKKWAGMIELAYHGKVTKVTRYSIKKEPDIFQPDSLKKYADTPHAGCRLCMLDEEIFKVTRKEKWMRDLTSQYESFEDYQRKGALGVVLVREDGIVSGASAYSVYEDGIEIEIDTREDCRRKGYALTCGAALILECLKQNKYPGWDAQNKGSVALCEKLGYHFDHEYTAYEIVGY